MTVWFDYTYGPQKKCQADNVEEGLLAIAHDDDLRIFEHVVCPSQLKCWNLYPKKASNARI